MIALRPGRQPDTDATSDAGETWRWLADVDMPGDSPLSRRTAAFMYRYRDHPEIPDGWHADCTIPGCGLIFPPEPDRVLMATRVWAHLRRHEFAVVDDPGRP